MKLKGKVALVTGASRGIGKRTALELAEQGADIVAVARTMEPGESRWPGSLGETAAQISAFGRQVLPMKCDLTIRADVENLCQAAIQRFGRMDIVVNNARYVGPGEGTWAPFLKISLEGWDRNIQANLMAPVITSRFFIPHMVQHGGGVIINITSDTAIREVPQMPGEGATSVVYAATKAALNRFVVGLAKETRADKIAVIAVDPGFTITEKFIAAAQANQALNFDYSQGHSMDVPAKAVAYLCSCEHPLQYSGQIIKAEEFIKQKGL